MVTEMNFNYIHILRPAGSNLNDAGLSLGKPHALPKVIKDRKRQLHPDMTRTFNHNLKQTYLLLT